ncbi:DNA polymerase epsilon catalytic subunit [Trichinella spiralis]|uniref:DNA polymerase epsilon catalytic subunit n=1 Tax=Trichinella spiralis TaxID=6334 RepID=A0ABR3KBZ5_TRISP
MQNNEELWTSEDEEAGKALAAKKALQASKGGKKNVKSVTDEILGESTSAQKKILKNKELGLFAYWVSIGSELHNVRLRAPRIFYVYQQIPKQIDSTDDELFSDTKVYPENPLIATSFLHVIVS